MISTDQGTKLYFGIDDYGMTPLTCQRIDDCLTHGAANKISVFMNSQMSDLKKLLASKKDTAVSVHLNLVEGQCTAPIKEVPLLVDADGYFKNSFFGLLTISLTPGKRKDFIRQVRLELSAQIARTNELFPEGTPLYLDSHQHTHMIPAIFTQLMEIIREEKLKVAYLRIPAEPITPFLAEPALYPQYLSLNLIKHWVLKCCNLFNAPKRKALGIPTALFCGIMFSGNMNYDRVSRVLPHYQKLASKKKCDIEFLFHSGYTLPGEPLFDPRKESFHPFYYSEGRKNEYDALMKLAQDVKGPADLQHKS